LERLEPYEGKLSRTVLRGGWAGNSLPPLDQIGVNRSKSDRIFAYMHSNASPPNPDPAPQMDPEIPMPEPASPFEYRGNCRIARLPKHLRDQMGAGNQSPTLCSIQSGAVANQATAATNIQNWACGSVIMSAKKRQAAARVKPRAVKDKVRAMVLIAVYGERRVPQD
jgi:hypothetical protein